MLGVMAGIITIIIGFYGVYYEKNEYYYVFLHLPRGLILISINTKIYFIEENINLRNENLRFSNEKLVFLNKYINVIIKHITFIINYIIIGIDILFNWNHKFDVIPMFIPFIFSFLILPIALFYPFIIN
jgi:hypothetical protein